MTGIELIAKERAEQIEKHGYTLSADRRYTFSELQNVVMCIVEGTPNRYWPGNWPIKVYYKIKNKPRIEQLTIAGAMLAAEIDRLTAEQVLKK